MLDIRMQTCVGVITIQLNFFVESSLFFKVVDLDKPYTYSALVSEVSVCLILFFVDEINFMVQWKQKNCIVFISAISIL